MADHTNTGRKIMPNFSVTDKQIIDSINYLNSGPLTVGQETRGYWNYGGGYITGTKTPYFISGPSCTFVANFNGTTMDVTSVITGELNLYDYIFESVADDPNNVLINTSTSITAFGTGTGGVGTYTISQALNTDPINDVAVTAVRYNPDLYPSGSGGNLNIDTVYRFYTPAYVSVKTTSITDSVLVTAQFRPFFRAGSDTGTDSKFNISIEVQRYLLVDPNIPFYSLDSFGFTNSYYNDTTIAQDNNAFNTLYTPTEQLTGYSSFGETVFTSIVDKPGVGYYTYALTVDYLYTEGDPYLEFLYAENLGITATVIKI